MKYILWRNSLKETIDNSSGTPGRPGHARLEYKLSKQRFLKTHIFQLDPAPAGVLENQLYWVQRHTGQAKPAMNRTFKRSFSFCKRLENFFHCEKKGMEPPKFHALNCACRRISLGAIPSSERVERGRIERIERGCVVVQRALQFCNRIALVGTCNRR